MASSIDKCDDRFVALHALLRSCLSSVSAGDSEAFLAALHALLCFCLSSVSAGDSEAFLAALHALSRFCLSSVSAGDSEAFLAALHALLRFCLSSVSAGDSEAFLAAACSGTFVYQCSAGIQRFSAALHALSRLSIKCFCWRFRGFLSSFTSLSRSCLASISVESCSSSFSSL